VVSITISPEITNIFEVLQEREYGLAQFCPLGHGDAPVDEGVYNVVYNLYDKCDGNNECRFVGNVKERMAVQC
jgi:hypothetical protein